MRLFFLVLLGFNFVYSQDCRIYSSEFRLVRFKKNVIYIEPSDARDIGSIFQVYVGFPMGGEPFQESENESFHGIVNHQIHTIMLPGNVLVPPIDEAHRVWIRRKCEVGMSLQYSEIRGGYTVPFKDEEDRCLEEPPTGINLIWKDPITLEVSSLDNSQSLYNIWVVNVTEQEYTDPESAPNDKVYKINTTLPYRLNLIDQNKKYHIFLRKNCDRGNLSWVGPFPIQSRSFDRHLNCFDNSRGLVDEILFASCDKNIPIVQSNKRNIQVLEELIFEFDEAGNQLKVRGDEIRISSSEKLNQEEEKEDWALHFQLAPNPTKGEVILSWDKKVDKLIAEMYLYPINGAYKIPIKFINNSLSSRINMASYTPGQYIVSILLKNGNKINKHIIRAF